MSSFNQQRTLAMMAGFERYTKKTRRAMFLEEMKQVVPWAKLGARIEPRYPKPGNGRRPKELAADPAVEEALYDSTTPRQFAGIDLVSEPLPDERTVCKFRHLRFRHPRVAAEVVFPEPCKFRSVRNTACSGCP